MNSDASLLERYVKVGDEEAFATLAKRHAGVVYGAALRVTGNRQDAEDVAQECFLTFARQAGSVRISLAGWLHALAVRRSQDIVRKTTRRRMREKSAAQNEQHVGEPTWEEIAPYVDEALAELPGELQEAVILHYLEGRTQEEIASQCGVNQSTVSRWIEKGVAALQDKLKKKGVMASAAFLAVLLSQRAAEAAPAALHVALGKMAIAGIGKASATGSGLIGGLSMAKAIGITAVLAGVVVTGGILVRQMSGEPVSSPAPVVAPKTDAVPTPVMEQDAVKLEYKLASGTELVYKTEGTAVMLRERQATATNGTLSAETRIVVCDTDTARRLATIGKLRSISLDMVVPTPQGEQRRNESGADADLLLIDATGRPIPRRWKLEDNSTDTGRRLTLDVMSQFNQNALDAVTLAPDSVTIGSQWESQFEFPVSSDVPVHAKARSILVAVKDVNGEKCALIKSTLLPAEEWMGRRGVTFTGEVETLFDIERGLTREFRMEIQLRSEDVAVVTFELKTKLASERIMPQEEAARYAALVKDIDAAVAKFCGNDEDGAFDALRALRMRDMPENWKNGVNGARRKIMRARSVIRELASTPLDKK